MKEFKFTGTLRPERIQPHASYHEAYQKFRAGLVSSNPYPEVEIIIRARDPRQDWIDEWYNDARRAEKEGTIIIRHCKDATFVCATQYISAYDAACAAPRHGDKYNQRTGIAVAYAKFCGTGIPDYI